MRLLLVEDDQDLADAIITGLKQKSFIIDWISEGKHALHYVQETNYALVILDIGLPDISGLQVLQNLRQHHIQTPVILLTARDTTEDTIEGLNQGADDYMSKPFDLNELIARIGALTRRSSGRSDTAIYYKHLTLDPIGRTLLVDKKNIYLPRREFNLLQTLLENQGKVLSREMLMQNLYSWEEEVDSNTLEVHMHNLRKKLNINTIRTIRGIGYILEKDIL
ncbi:MAG: DNA-binding response regulator [Gammaproteobacteria bacterium]|jgi:two-component system response regulator QseB|nr:DNA-binding response regulator [Gammaproteobacteria bacterium]